MTTTTTHISYNALLIQSIGQVCMGNQFSKLCHYLVRCLRLSNTKAFKIKCSSKISKQPIIELVVQNNLASVAVSVELTAPGPQIAYISLLDIFITSMLRLITITYRDISTVDNQKTYTCTYQTTEQSSCFEIKLMSEPFYTATLYRWSIAQVSNI